MPAADDDGSVVVSGTAFAPDPFDRFGIPPFSARPNGATMQPQSLDARVERLERRVTTLEQLPARVDALTLQVSQLREEMHAEFSAIKAEIRAGDQEIMTHARVLYEDMKATLALMQEGLPTRRHRRPAK